MSGTVITVASGKGGVGKTTTAVNLAVALWTDGNAVAIVDADLGMPNLAAALGLDPESTIHDVLAGRTELDVALTEAKNGDLLVLPGERSLAGFAAADPDRLGAVLDTLAERCAYVVVDTGAGLSYEDVLPLGLADQVVLVTTPDPAAITDTHKTLELAGMLDAPVRGVVVTRVRDDTDVEAVAAEVGTDLLGTVPEDSAVNESTAAGDPLASHAPEAPATAAYAELAATIQGEAPMRRGGPTAEAAPTGPEPPAAAGEGDEGAESAAADDGDTADGMEADDSAADEETEEPSTDEATDDDSAVSAEEPADDGGRGGLTGWLARRFS